MPQSRSREDSHLAQESHPGGKFLLLILKHWIMLRLCYAGRQIDTAYAGTSTDLEGLTGDTTNNNNMIWSGTPPVWNETPPDPFQHNDPFVPCEALDPLFPGIPDLFSGCTR